MIILNGRLYSKDEVVLVVFFFFELNLFCTFLVHIRRAVITQFYLSRDIRD